MGMRRKLQVTAALILTTLLAISAAQAEVISDIRNTKHNFSATFVPSLPEGISRTVQASSESQICAFCHTPHKGTQQGRAPIWNRKLSGATYTPYTSSSIDAIDLGQPNTKSKLCLSCHDGTLAIGSVNVLNRVENVTVDMQGTDSDGSMAAGLGERTGFTRRLGTDLTNDHPISFTYDSAQAFRDGELRDPAAQTVVGERRRGGHKPTLPLEDNQVECITCHDPHVRGTSGENIKFLRVNRFQKNSPPVVGAFNRANDILCLACHDKSGWVDSAHANPLVGDERYTDIAAEIREFPKNTPVWQAACLNCHDIHTVEGSRRLLREGTDDPGQLYTSANGSIRIKQGGKAAIEETCYACHSTDGNVLQGQSNKGVFQVPDIKTDFTTLQVHMPIASVDQPAGEERHSIGTYAAPQNGKDFMESRQRMGKGDLSNRHAECTDCHNPHRVIKNRRFNDDPKVPDIEGTHVHNVADFRPEDNGAHTNLASGVLRGAWGVEPTAWSSTEFTSQPIAFDVKRGDSSPGASTDVSSPYVTREYQICMKCHSNYGYDSPPPLSSNHAGGTNAGTNSLNNYTNQGMEYQSPDSHRGEGEPVPFEPGGAYLNGSVGDCAEVNVGTLITAGPSGDPDYNGSIKRAGYFDDDGNCVNYRTDNHRAWHPVMKPTGRTAPQGGGALDTAVNVRNADGNDWHAPFNVAVGIQTMYCTDCHGSDTVRGTVVPPDPQPHGNVWGPHGSNNNFLLKGTWDDNTGQDTAATGLCFKCHNYDFYGKKFPDGPLTSAQTQRSGFQRDPLLGGAGCLNVANFNLHTGHAQTNRVQNFRCNYCHIAIPHGWKNKNFLVNLNDVGREVGLPTGGNQVRNRTTNRYYRGPYYNGSVLKVVQFRQSGHWVHNSCGSAGSPGNGLVGGNNNFGNIPWMTDPGAGSEACNQIP
jgi:hypothetical protein